MFTFFGILIVVVSVLLVIVVLIQNSKGGGLATNINVVAQASQTFGTRQLTDNIEKTTWLLAGVLGALCVAAYFSLPSANYTTNDAVQQNKLRIQRSIENQNVTPYTPPQSNQPGQPVGQPQQQPAAPAGE